MSQADYTAVVHSVAEAYLYLKTIACRRCEQGPLEHTRDLMRTDDAKGGWRIEAQCRRCGAGHRVDLAVDPPPTRASAASSAINPTSEPSRAIDLLGWLNLFHAILHASDEAADRETGRTLAMEAAQCLDEALKFYRPGEEIPDASVFFTEQGRDRLREHPEQFAQSRWRERRLRLPHASGSGADKGPKKHRWWQWWRRSD